MADTRDPALTGPAVVRQSQDNSVMNTDPLVVKAAVIGVATSLLVAAGAFGLVTEEQRTIVIEQIGNIAYGLAVILPLLITMITALWARLSVYAPRTAARIAVDNAKQPADSPPTLAPPP